MRIRDCDLKLTKTRITRDCKKEETKREEEEGCIELLKRKRGKKLVRNVISVVKN